MDLPWVKVNWVGSKRLAKSLVIFLKITLMRLISLKCAVVLISAVLGVRVIKVVLNLDINVAIKESTKDRKKILLKHLLEVLIEPHIENRQVQIPYRIQERIS